LFKYEYKRWQERGDIDFSQFIDDTLDVLAFKKFQEKAFLKKSFFEYLAADEEFQDNLNAAMEVYV